LELSFGEFKHSLQKHGEIKVYFALKLFQLCLVQPILLFQSFEILFDPVVIQIDLICLVNHFHHARLDLTGSCFDTTLEKSFGVLIFNK
jgi:hypothetical protein